ncbi:MAG: CPBP family intramembrane glutamic endopeptidase [Myxococcota bacterium]
MTRWLDSFRDALAQTESELDAARADRESRRLDVHVIGIVVVASVMLTLQEYYGSSSDYTTLTWPLGLVMGEADAEAWVKEVFRAGEYARLHRLFYWVAITSATYVLGPALYIRLVMRQRVVDFGFGVKGIFKHAWIYLGMYAVVLPCLFLVGQADSFQRTYPFYGNAGRSAYDFFAWETAYAIQFLSLEFFFRGFLVHGLKSRFGFYAILVSVMPYCMIHFGKPMPETLGAILAGIALGALSLFTRSIWLGVAIHVSVAVSMDLISLWLQGKLL